MCCCRVELPLKEAPFKGRGVYNGGVRILLLNYEFPPVGGGAAPVSYEIAKRLVETGDYEVDVVTMGFGDLPAYEELQTGFRVHRVKCLRKRKEICQPWEQATYLITAYFKAWQLLRKNKYDICHCHFIIPTGALAWVLKKQFGLEYIISVHGSDVPGYNPDRFTLLHKFTRPFLRVICRNAQKVVALSAYLKELIQENIERFDDNHLIVIPNGIDPSKFVPLTKEKIILSTGRLLPRKGFQYLIQAVSDEDMGYEVHICGDGPMMGELKSLAQKSHTKIVFHGWVNNESDEYKNLLGRAAIYCLVSSRENSSIALLEAMSAGCVVVTSNISGCPETIGDSGVAIHPENSDLLRATLKELIGDPSLLDVYATRARQRTVVMFDWNKIVEKYVQILTL